MVQLSDDRNILILDSWPVLEWLKFREPTLSIFDSILLEARAGRLKLIMSTINVGEIYYNCIYFMGLTRADEILADLRRLPIEIIHPTEEDSIRAARIKGLYQGAYGDAFAAVLAIDWQARVLTGDKDFLKLQAAGLLIVQWLGK